MECDGQRLDLDPDIEGLLIINIPSYMGGVNLWASSAASPSRRRFVPQSFSDGLLEVVHKLMQLLSSLPIQDCGVHRNFATGRAIICLCVFV